MEELKVSPEELKNLIDNGKLIGKGFFGAVFTYKDKLIKLDKSLYNLLSANDKVFARDVIESHYKFGDMQEDFSDLDQLHYLASKQKNIKLTKLPEGFVSMRDVSPRIMGISPGIIIPYHRDYQGLHLLSKKDYQKVLVILKKLLLAVKELADNEIAHEDLVVHGSKREYNVLYKDDTPQIIDLSGDLICAGDTFISAKEMYRQLGEIIYYYTKESDKESIIVPYVASYEDNKYLLDKYEERISK